jgi:hypothetical protein
LRAHFARSGRQIPPGYDDESGMMLRYLQAEKFEYEQGMNAIFEHFNWLKKTFPMDPEAPESFKWYRLANLGFLYVAKRDKKNRPVLVMNVEKII